LVGIAKVLGTRRADPGRPGPLVAHAGLAAAGRVNVDLLRALRTIAAARSVLGAFRAVWSGLEIPPNAGDLNVRLR
jgi:hypothetical protein